MKLPEQDIINEITSISDDSMKGIYPLAFETYKGFGNLILSMIPN